MLYPGSGVPLAMFLNSFLLSDIENGHRKRKEGAPCCAVNDGNVVDEPIHVLTVVVVLHKITPANNMK